MKEQVNPKDKVQSSSAPTLIAKVPGAIIRYTREELLRLRPPPDDSSDSEDSGSTELLWEPDIELSAHPAEDESSEESVVSEVEGLLVTPEELTPSGAAIIPKFGVI